MEEAVASRGEELDVVIWRGDSCYFVECKWEKKPTSPKHLRDFSGKLAERTGVRGMFVSMLGFTEAAVEKARDRIGTTPMILLGPRDVEDLFNDDRKLGDLIEEKYRALVMRKTLTFR